MAGGQRTAAPPRAAYLFDNAAASERERLAAIELTWDPGTFQQLRAVGAGAGWRCLEVGAGAGSVARWLAGRVGPSGHVVALDVDARFLRGSGAPNLEVQERDVTASHLPEAAFDLVHARMVVQHLADPDGAVARMAAALRPGGWLVLEDSHWGSLLATAPPSPLLERLERALRQVMTAAGFDPDCGLRHAERLRRLGLAERGAEGRVAVMTGTAPGATWYRLWVRRLAGRLLETRLLSERDLDQVLETLADPGSCWLSQVLIATRGRAPLHSRST